LENTQTLNFTTLQRVYVLCVYTPVLYTSPYKNTPSISHTLQPVTMRVVSHIIFVAILVALTVCVRHVHADSKSTHMSQSQSQSQSQTNTQVVEHDNLEVLNTPSCSSESRLKTDNLLQPIEDSCSALWDEADTWCTPTCHDIIRAAYKTVAQDSGIRDCVNATTKWSTLLKNMKSSGCGAPASKRESAKRDPATGAPPTNQDMIDSVNGQETFNGLPSANEGVALGYTQRGEVFEKNTNPPKPKQHIALRLDPTVCKNVRCKTGRECVPTPFRTYACVPRFHANACEKNQCPYGSRCIIKGAWELAKRALANPNNTLAKIIDEVNRNDNNVTVAAPQGVGNITLKANHTLPPVANETANYTCVWTVQWTGTYNWQGMPAPNTNTTGWKKVNPQVRHFGNNSDEKVPLTKWERKACLNVFGPIYNVVQQCKKFLKSNPTANNPLVCPHNCANSLRLMKLAIDGARHVRRCMDLPQYSDFMLKLTETACGPAALNLADTSNYWPKPDLLRVPNPIDNKHTHTTKHLRSQHFAQKPKPDYTVDAGHHTATSPHLPGAANAPKSIVVGVPPAETHVEAMGKYQMIPDHNPPQGVQHPSAIPFTPLTKKDNMEV
jgi:hypothetical protein